MSSEPTLQERLDVLRLKNLMLITRAFTARFHPDTEFSDHCLDMLADDHNYYCQVNGSRSWVGGESYDVGAPNT